MQSNGEILLKIAEDTSAIKVMVAGHSERIKCLEENDKRQDKFIYSFLAIGTAIGVALTFIANFFQGALAFMVHK